jgi:hypothetical protein
MQSTADSGRDDQARVLLATAGQWLKVRDGWPPARLRHAERFAVCARTAAPWRCTSRASALSRSEGGGSRRLLIGQTPAAAG